MPINKDQSGVPTQTPAPIKPDAEPRFMPRLARTWHALYLEGGNDKKARAVPGTKVRASWAGGCDRALAYRIAEVDPSNPPGLADTWRMGLGQLVHEGLEDVIAEAFPGAEIEMPIDLRPDVDGSATGDVGLVIEGTRVWLELKTINGFGFKCAVTNWKGPAEGPKSLHKKQAALGAYAWNADEMVLGYISMENISPKIAESNGITDDIGRFCAEWSFDRAEIEALATAEHARLNNVMESMHLESPEPTTQVLRQVHLDEIPQGAVIDDPSTGKWVLVDTGAVIDAGKTWLCDYCWHRDRCLQDGA